MTQSYFDSTTNGIFSFLKFIYFNWRLITLQNCGGFCHASTSISHGVHVSTHPPPSPPHLSGLSQSTGFHCLALCIELALVICFDYAKAFDCVDHNSVPLSSVTQSCPTLCDPMNCRTPGLPVHHQLPEFTQTHVHRVGDAIQSSHPLSSPSLPAPNPSQPQSLFQ